MIHYILHTTILLALAYVFYWIFLKKETFYKLNRHFLILAIFAALSIPLVNVPASMSFNNPTKQNLSSTATPSITDPIAITSPVVSNPSAPIPNKGNEEVLSKETTVGESFIEKMSSWNWSKILWILYFSGALVFLATFIIQFTLIILKKNKLESIQDGNYTIYELNDNSSPFSFYNWIFINPSLYEPDTFEQIIAHEKVHVSQSHYLDKILAEILVILFWFSPFSWLYRKAITNNLEFLTDSEILGQGVEPESYQMSLLKVSVPQHPLTLTTNYNESFLTQRIKMMNERKSSAKSSWKYLLIVPIVFLTMASLNAVQTNNNVIAESQEQNKEENKEKEEVNNKQKDKQKNKEKQNNKISTATSSNVSGATPTSVVVSVNDTIDPDQSNYDYQFQTNHETNSETNHSHSSWNSHNIEPGHWSGTIDGNQISLVMNHSDPKGKWTWINSMYFDKNEFSSISNNEEGEMRVVRDAGKLILTGLFSGSEGEGKFEFLPNKEFSDYLKSKNIKKIDDKELFHLFINNMNKSFIDELIAAGYSINSEKLVEMSIHNINRDRFKTYQKIFKDLGIENTEVNQLVELSVHNVSKEYIDELVQYDFQDLSLSQIVAAKIHHVNPEMVKTLKKEGYEVSLSKLIEFSIHNIEKEDIESYGEYGYDDLSSDKMIEFSIHGVTSDFIEGLAKAGYKDLSPSKLVEFKIHGVTPEYVTELNSLGYTDIAPSKLVEFLIHGVSTNFISELNDLDYKDIPSYRLVEFKIHGVTSEFIRELKSLGYSDVNPNKLIEARIHGVTPNFIKGFQKLGHTDLTITKLVELSIHNIQPEDFKK